MLTPQKMNLAQPLTQLTFFCGKCWRPNQPIAVEIRFYTIISQMKPHFGILQAQKRPDVWVKVD